MGISGLFSLLKSIQRPIELNKYSGETLGIDAYGWLHRGAIACAVELAQGKPTKKFVHFAMNRVRMLQHFGIKPYVVFDGDYLPSKASTEASRAFRRETTKKLGLELLKAGKPSQAYAELQKAIDVTPEMARCWIEELKKANVPYIVAPFEADPQLVYLEREGIIDGIISEDSDLLIFGAKRLLSKLDAYGNCIEINRKDFCAVREISLTGWTDDSFRHMAILSGCDYLGGISYLGLKTAYRFIRAHKTPERVIRMLQLEGKHKIPQDYAASFKKADLTFLHQRVFCPKRKCLVCLTEPGPSVQLDSMPFIGQDLEPELARAIAVGDMHPMTKKPMSATVSPGSKRRISQTMMPADPPRRPEKPIDGYFKTQGRIPLGEMEPNCFMVEPRENNGVLEPVERRIFPLPRPYIPSTSSQTDACPYTRRSRARRSEPILTLGLGSQTLAPDRRRTIGPGFQVHQDPYDSKGAQQDAESIARSPKKARLCENLTGRDAQQETSKYFLITGATQRDGLSSRSTVTEAPTDRNDQAPSEVMLRTPLGVRVHLSSRRSNQLVQTISPSSRKSNGQEVARRTPLQTAIPLATPLQRMGERALNRATEKNIDRAKNLGLASSPVNAASAQFPTLVLAEVATLNASMGSEDQITPGNDDEEYTGSS